MHPFFAETMIRTHERELDRRVRTARAHRETPGRPGRPQEPVTLRLARPQDERTLLELAQLEGRPEPRGRWIVAEIDGSVVAALSVASREFLGNPFRPTAHLAPLLELRAKQLTAASARRYPIALWGAIRGWGRA